MTDGLFLTGAVVKIDTDGVVRGHPIGKNSYVHWHCNGNRNDHLR